MRKQHDDDRAWQRAANTSALIVIFRDLAILLAVGIWATLLFREVF